MDLHLFTYLLQKLLGSVDPRSKVKENTLVLQSFVETPLELLRWGIYTAIYWHDTLLNSPASICCFYLPAIHSICCAGWWIPHAICHRNGLPNVDRCRESPEMHSKHHKLAAFAAGNSTLASCYGSLATNKTKFVSYKESTESNRAFHKAF